MFYRMKKSNKIIFVIVAIAFTSCKRRDHANEIVFENNTSSVQDSLLAMARLIRILPDNGQFNVNYDYTFDYITVNGGPGKSEDDKALDSLSSNDKLRFTELANFLKHNYINGGYINKNLNQVLFQYRHFPEDQFDDVREVIVFKNSDTSFMKNFFQILDHKNSIFLFAPLEAKIR